MQQLESRIDYTKFWITTFKRLILPTAATQGGWWLFQNAPANRVVCVWLMMIGSIWMTFAFFAFFDVVTWFRVQGDFFEISRFGRRRKVLPVASACAFTETFVSNRHGIDRGDQLHVEGITVGFIIANRYTYPFATLSAEYRRARKTIVTGLTCIFVMAAGSD